MTTFGNLTKPFGLGIWLLSLAAIGAISVSVALAHRMYTRLGMPPGVVAPEQNWANFFIFPFCKVAARIDTN